MASMIVHTLETGCAGQPCSIIVTRCCCLRSEPVGTRRTRAARANWRRPGKVVERRSTDDVCAWLVREGMGLAAGAVRERKIDGKESFPSQLERCESAKSTGRSPSRQTHDRFIRKLRTRRAHAHARASNQHMRNGKCVSRCARASGHVQTS